MIDLDTFKLVNDRHGHDFADQVLVGFAQLLQAQRRLEDVTCCFGGDVGSSPRLSEELGRRSRPRGDRPHLRHRADGEALHRGRNWSRRWPETRPKPKISSTQRI